MIGYVLWSDVTVGKAIIWCEDQGDLAYYSKKGDTSQIVICKGDWVQFDLTEVGNIRLAANASVLDDQGYPGLADMLVEASPIKVEAQKQTTGSLRGGNVIPFPLQSKRNKTVRYG